MVGIRSMIDQMRETGCEVNLHVVPGARHNPFDSGPPKMLETKNRETREVIANFVRDCVRADVRVFGGR